MRRDGGQEGLQHPPPLAPPLPLLPGTPVGEDRKSAVFLFSSSTFFGGEGGGTILSSMRFVALYSFYTGSDSVFAMTGY